MEGRTRKPGQRGTQGTERGRVLTVIMRQTASSSGDYYYLGGCKTRQPCGHILALKFSGNFHFHFCFFFTGHREEQSQWAVRGPCCKRLNKELTGNSRPALVGQGAPDLRVDVASYLSPKTMG